MEVLCHRYPSPSGKRVSYWFFFCRACKDNPEPMTCVRGGKIVRTLEDVDVVSDESNDSERDEWRDEDEERARMLKYDATYQNALDAIKRTAQDALADEYPTQLALVNDFLINEMHSNPVEAKATSRKQQRIEGS
jgi:hypothetical protein